MRALLAQLAEHGTVLLVMDQPATVGALPVAVAQASGALVGYLPGLAMRRIADPHPGEARTEARHAAIIAETARTCRCSATSTMRIHASAARQAMRSATHPKSLWHPVGERQSAKLRDTV